MGLLRAGSHDAARHERFLLNALTVPPISATDEYGANPAIDGDLTTGTAVLALEGSYRVGNTKNATITITVPELGRLPAINAESVHGLFDSGFSVSEITRAALRQPGSGDLPTVRIAVQRTNWDAADDAAAIGLTEDFNRWPAVNSEIDPGAVVVDLAIRTLPDGTCRLVMLLSDSIIVKSFDPSVDADWIPLVTLTGLGALTGLGYGFTAVDLAVNGTDVLLYVLAGNVTTQTERFYVFQLQGSTVATASLTYLNNPVRLPSLGNFPSVVTYYTIAAVGINGSTLVAAMVAGDGFTGSGGAGGGSGALYGGPNGDSTIFFGQSADQKNWGGPDAGHPEFSSISDFTNVKHDTGSSVNALSFAPDNLTGWAVCQGGQIWMTVDGGREWIVQVSPSAPGGRSGNLTDIGIALFGVHAVSATVAYAVGGAGLILSTTDGGVTWLVNRFSGIGTMTADKFFDAASWIGGAMVSPVDTANKHYPGGFPFGGNFYGVRFKDATHGWACGSHGVIMHTSNGGATWRYLVPTAHPASAGGSYRAIVYEGTDGNGDTIQVLGDYNAGDSTQGSPAILRVVHAEYDWIVNTPANPSPTLSYPLNSAQLISWGNLNFVAATQIGTSYYAVTSRGKVYRWDSLALVWNAISDLQASGDPTRYGISAPTADLVIVVSGNKIWRTLNAGTTAPVFVPQRTDIDARSCWFFDATVGVIGGTHGIEFGAVALSSRVYPSLLLLHDGTVIFACANVTEKYVELYRIEDPLGQRRMTLVDHAMTFATVGDAPRPSLTQTETGEIICTAGPTRLAPTVAATSGPGITGTRQYRVAVLTTGNGARTLSSKASFPVTFADQKAVVTFAAAGNGAVTEIYATPLNGQGFFFLGTAPGTSTGSTTFTDDGTVRGSPWTGTGALDYSRPAPPCDGGRVSPAGNNGQQWVWRDDPSLPIPIGAITTDTGDPGYPDLIVQRYRRILALRGGRLMSVIPNKHATKVGTFMAREWQPSGTKGVTHFAPVDPNVPQWSGVDNINLVWLGIPKVGDTYTISPRYDYPKSHLAIESPSIFTRTSHDNQEVTYVYDAGAGNLVEVIGFSLFGVNVYNVIFGLSLDGTHYTTLGGSEWEVDRVNGVPSQDPVQLAGAAFNFTPLPTTGATGVLLRTGSGTMMPRQYRRGLQRYYAYCFGDGYVYDVLDNSANSLTIDSRGRTLTASSVTVFGDRLFLAPTALIGSASRFARFVRIRVPSQRTAQEYYILGTPIIGVYENYRPFSGTETRHRFNQGFGLQASPSTLKQIGLSQVSSTEHFGDGPMGKYSLTYAELLADDRDMLLNGLIPKLRQAFCFQPDAADNSNVLLLQLTDGPQISNTQGDRYTLQLNLEEVK